MQRRPDGTKHSRHVQLRHSRPFQKSRRVSSNEGIQDVGASTRRAKEKLIAVIVLGVAAWAVPVSPGTRGTPAMLEAVLLAARKSESEVE